MGGSNLLAVIPARGGSKGIEKKNIRQVGGKPLLAHSIEAAVNATTVDTHVVSTDSEEIRAAAEEHGGNVPFTRPGEFATDEAAMEPVVEHAIDAVDEPVDEVILLQPTSPLRTADHVDDAIGRLHSTDADSMVSVTTDHSYRWAESDTGAERINYHEGRKRRQEKSPEFVENGAIYAVNVDRFLETGDLLAGRTSLYVMDQDVSIDVDSPFDLWLVRKIFEDWHREGTK